MKGKTLLCSMLFVLITAPSTLAQRQKIEVHRLNCEGVFFNAPARVQGIRRYQGGRYYSEVEFSGQLQTPQGTFGFDYAVKEIREGIIYANPKIRVSVLDNGSGNKMVIYHRGPNKIGEFVCRWTRLQ